MRITIVSCVFPPEPVVSAQTSGQIVDELVKRGHEVTVVAPFPNRPGGYIFPGFKRRLFPRRAVEDYFQIVRCLSFFSEKSTLFSRFWENISFGWVSGLCPESHLWGGGS